MKTSKIILGLFISTTLFSACRGTNKPTRVGAAGALDQESNPGVDPTVQNQEDPSTLSLTCSEASQRGLRSLRKLSNVEITNTITDVFGLTTGLDTSEFSVDIQKSAGGFDNVMVEANFVDERRLSGYLKLAASVGANVDIAKLFPCVSQGASCFTTTLPKLAASAFRRPATAGEIANLDALGKQLIADGNKPEDAARFLIQAIVVSQGFLYRSELGTKLANGDYQLNDWELASALSYLITRRPPDAELRALAEKGGLKTSAVLKTQAERLMATAAAKTSWAEFADMWLVPSDVISHDPKITEFTPAVRASLAKETKDFFVSVLYNDKAGTFEQLLNADYTVAGDDLSWLYGAKSSNNMITFAEKQRRGLLGQGSFLASHASAISPSPITRGAYIMKKLLCTDFVGVPPSPVLDGTAANQNGRELRKTSKACSSCHSSIDPVGFTFETFDVVGRFRTKDELGAVINTQNTLAIDGKDVSYDGAAELSAAIASSDQGLECFSRQVFRFSMGRMERAKMSVVGSAKAFVATKESERDACYIQSMTKAMQSSNGSLKEGILALVASPAFRLRTEVKTAP